MAFIPQVVSLKTFNLSCQFHMLTPPLLWSSPQPWAFLTGFFTLKKKKKLSYQIGCSLSKIYFLSLAGRASRAQHTHNRCLLKSYVLPHPVMQLQDASIYKDQLTQRTLCLYCSKSQSMKSVCIIIIHGICSDDLLHLIFLIVGSKCACLSLPVKSERA